MIQLPEFIPATWMIALGMTVLHSLWQGIIIVLFLNLLFYLGRGTRSTVKYGMAVVGLLLLVGISLTTFFVEFQAAQYSFAQESWRTSSQEKLYGAFEYTTQLSEKNTSATLAHLIWKAKAYWNNISPFMLPWISYVWMIGSLLFLLRSMGSYFFVVHLRSKLTESLPSEYEFMLRELCIKMNISRKVMLRSSGNFRVPITIGQLKPIILLPFSVITLLSPAQIETILVHELAHIKRYDYWVNMMQTWLEVLFFYHPAFWWLNRMINEHREYCCDDMVVAYTGNPMIYARALTELGAISSSVPSLALAAHGKRSALLNRIQRMMLPGTSHPISLRYVLGGVLCLIFVIGFAWKEQMRAHIGTQNGNIEELVGINDMEIANGGTFVSDTPPPPPSVPHPVPEPEEPAVAPEAESVPELPEIPEAPRDMLLPALPATPEVPEIPELPEAPRNMLLPALPATPEVPEIPEIPPIEEGSTMEAYRKAMGSYKLEVEQWRQYEQQMEEYEEAMKSYEETVRTMNENKLEEMNQQQSKAMLEVEKEMLELQGQLEQQLTKKELEIQRNRLELERNIRENVERENTVSLERNHEQLLEELQYLREEMEVRKIEHETRLKEVINDEEAQIEAARQLAYMHKERLAVLEEQARKVQEVESQALQELELKAQEHKRFLEEHTRRVQELQGQMVEREARMIEEQARVVEEHSREVEERAKEREAERREMERQRDDLIRDLREYLERVEIIGTNEHIQLEYKGGGMVKVNGKELTENQTEMLLEIFEINDIKISRDSRTNIEIKQRIGKNNSKISVSICVP